MCAQGSVSMLSLPCNDTPAQLLQWEMCLNYTLPANCTINTNKSDNGIGIHSLRQIIHFTDQQLHELLCYYSVQTLLPSRLLSKNLKIKIYKTNNTASCAIWLWSMVSYIKGGTQDKGIWKQDPEASTFAQKGQEWGMENILQWENWTFVPSPNVVRVIKSIRLRWSVHVARMKDSGSALKILRGKVSVKTPLGRPRRRWKDDIRINLKK